MQVLVKDKTRDRTAGAASGTQARNPQDRNTQAAIHRAPPPSHGVAAPKFVLVNVPTSRSAYNSFRTFAATPPPIGLATIGACLERAGCDASILDADALDLTIEETVDRVTQAAPDYVGSTTWTATMDITYDFYARLKRRLPKTTIIAGGPHVTALPQQTLEESPDIDVAVLSEGDATTLDLMDALATGRDPATVQGIAFRDAATGRIVQTPCRPLVKDLSSLPSPAFHLLDFGLYRSYGWNNWVSGHRSPLGVLFTGRGCYGKCNFCASNQVFGRGMRYFPLQRIKDEIDLLVQKYNIRILYFQDDTFTANRKVVQQVCDHLIQSGYHKRLEIMCSARCDAVHLPTLEKMRQAGFRWICFGVERGNQQILDRMGKHISVAQIKRAYELARRAGLYIVGNFMIGHIGETHESACETIDLACELDQEYVSFSIAIPFPGTELYEHARKRGVEIPSWNGFGNVNTPPIPLNDALGVEALKSLRNLAVNRFFRRPRYIGHMLWHMNPLAVTRDFLSMYWAIRSERKAGRF